MKTTNVFGIPFANLDIAEVASNIVDSCYDKKIIVTPNVDHIVRLQNPGDFRDVYMSSDLFLNDSRILKILSKLIGKPIDTLIPGSDLTKKIFDIIKDRKDIPIAIIGANKEAVSKLKAIYNINNITHYNPPMGFHTSEIEIEKCVSVCMESKAVICFLAVGSPKQELLAQKLRTESAPGCYLCIGASLLFLVGEEKRAPIFIQKIALEWLFRLMQSPRRLWKRYLKDGPKIFIIAIKEIFRS